MTCGPYRSITLSTYNARIDDFNPQARLECADSDQFKFHLTSSLTLAVTGSTASLLRDKASDIPFEVLYAIKDSKGDDVASGKQTLSKQDIEGRLALSDGAYVTLELPTLDLGQALKANTKVKPWWPVGYGDQDLYNFEVKLTTLVWLSPHLRDLHSDVDIRTEIRSTLCRSALVGGRWNWFRMISLNQTSTGQGRLFSSG